MVRWMVVPEDCIGRRLQLLRVVYRVNQSKKQTIEQEKDGNINIKLNKSFRLRRGICRPREVWGSNKETSQKNSHISKGKSFLYWNFKSPLDYISHVLNEVINLLYIQRAVALISSWCGLLELLIGALCFCVFIIARKSFDNVPN